jgi:hypothetical protein
MLEYDLDDTFGHDAFDVYATIVMVKLQED